MKTYKDVSFKKVDGHDLYLDVYMPEEKNPPLIMWIHGGGWKELNKDWNLIMPMLERGYAIASVEYRYSDEGPFPTQMYDLKDALLYLKTHAKEYGYDEKKVAVSGDSAGGHLCIMLGVSAGNKDWESTDGDYSVQAVVDFCGPGWLKPGNNPDGVIETLLGSVYSKTGLARAAMACPATYIDGSEPPFLILQGSEDPTVNPEQARMLRNALEAKGVPAHMYYVPGGEHGLSGHIVNDIICEFLDYYIKGQKTVITPELQQCHQRTLPYMKK